MSKLHHRIQLQQAATVTDDYNTESFIWSDLAEVWADIKPLSGRELESAQRIHEDTTHSVKIRYRKNVTGKLRFLYKGRVFHVVGVINENEANRWLNLQAVDRLGESG